MTPQDIVEKQLRFYNQHEIDGFLSQFDANIEVFTWNRPDPELVGIEPFKARYVERFKKPLLKATVIKRMVQGNVVVDEEVVEGLSEEPVHLLVIFEIENSKIRKVTFVR